MAELERDNILERQAEGIAIAKAEGRMTGRPKKAVDTFEGVYLNVKEGKLSASAGAKQLGISRSTWYRKVKILYAAGAWINGGIINQASILRFQEYKFRHQ